MAKKKSPRVRGGFSFILGRGLPEDPATEVAGLGYFVGVPFLLGHGWTRDPVQNYDELMCYLVHCVLLVSMFRGCRRPVDFSEICFPTTGLEPAFIRVGFDRMTIFPWFDPLDRLIGRSGRDAL